MKVPDVINSPIGWLSSTIIISFITGITTKIFASRNQVSEPLCMERRNNIEKKLDYLIQRIDDHFDK